MITHDFLIQIQQATKQQQEIVVRVFEFIGDCFVLQFVKKW